MKSPIQYNFQKKNCNIFLTLPFTQNIDWGYSKKRRFYPVPKNKMHIHVNPSLTIKKWCSMGVLITWACCHDVILLFFLIVRAIRPNNCGRHLGKLIGHNSTYVLSGRWTFRQFFLLIPDGFSKIKLRKKCFKFV